ncbi:hypothetical protein PSCLAVI8L_100163 [Pseudoclavibacter sp. 8L]|nr:hypothetical protein PSCLAVI8L_100163 [Pseudoclavibacter sp. 8L]
MGCAARFRSPGWGRGQTIRNSLGPAPEGSRRNLEPKQGGGAVPVLAKCHGIPLSELPGNVVHIRGAASLPDITGYPPRY